MLGMLLKLILLVVIILVGLQIFSPETAQKAVDQISETTGVEKSTLEKNLDKATQFTLDSADKVAQAAKEKIEQAQEELDKK